MEKIILFQIADDREVKKLAGNLRIRLIYAGEDNLTDTIEAIAEGKKSATVLQPSGKVTESALIFCDVSEKHFNKILFELRKKNALIDYKAVMTPTNKKWTLSHLLEELKKEKDCIFHN